MKKRFLVAIGLMMLITLQACFLTRFNPFNRVNESPMPELAIDNSYFAGLGCFTSPDCLPEELKNIENPVQAIYEPSALLGGLDPALPIAEASTVSFDYETTIPAVYSNGCMATQYVRYLVFVEDEIRLIDSMEDMRELYAPIESDNEALSYAVAVTGLTPIYDFDQQPRLKLVTRPITETTVAFDGEKYVVHLFDTYICGCGPHVVSSVDVSVFPDGTVSLSDPIGAYSDPETDDLCID